VQIRADEVGVVLSSENATYASPDDSWGLPALQECCQEELTRFRKDKSKQESICCLNIVQRAAAGDDDALSTLMTLSQQLVQNRCPADLRHLQEDMAQTLAERLIHVFRKRGHPFQAQSFPAYRNYLNLTYHSVFIETSKAHPKDASLDRLREAGFEQAGQGSLDDVDRRLLLQRFLELLPDEQMRDAFRRRMTAGESPDEIAQALGITKQQVYRLLEKAIRKLKKQAEVQDMMEE
jgi:RNA polymerase sigma factor (sigma-70 family)